MTEALHVTVMGGIELTKVRSNKKRKNKGFKFEIKSVRPRILRGSNFKETGKPYFIGTLPIKFGNKNKGYLFKV